MTFSEWIWCAFIVLSSALAFGFAGAVLPTILLVAIGAIVGVPESIRDPFMAGGIMFFGGLALGTVGLIIGLTFGVRWASASSRDRSF